MYRVLNWFADMTRANLIGASETIKLLIITQHIYNLSYFYTSKFDHFFFLIDSLNTILNEMKQ